MSRPWSKHLPSSDHPSHEFETPSNGWYCICRAIVFDSWLLWSDALPEDLELRKQLDQESFDNITALAKKIHSFHHSFPGWKQIDSSPFKVPCWWDPSHEDPAWRKGRRCLLSLEDYTGEELKRLLPKRNPLKIKIVSKNYVEIYLSSSSLEGRKASESSKMLPV